VHRVSVWSLQRFLSLVTEYARMLRARHRQCGTLLDNGVAEHPLLKQFGGSSSFVYHRGLDSGFAVEKSGRAEVDDNPRSPVEQLSALLIQ
jgi:hypothetical protein